MGFRVAQWATGNVGKLALKSIIRHPALELVGVAVTTPGKVGKDAAEICGLDNSTGIRAVDDGRELIALKPDCICYCGDATSGMENPVPEDWCSTATPKDLDAIVDILSAGINVVSPSLIPLLHPASAPAMLVDPIAAACRRGNSTFFGTGLEPGIMDDVFPVVLSGLCIGIDCIKISEVMNYDLWDKDYALRGKFGFGRPMNYLPPMASPEVVKLAWGPMVRMLAEQIGITLDRLEPYLDLSAAREAFDIPAMRIEEGTIAAMRFGVRGICNGRSAINIEHVTRLRTKDAPQWPKPPIGERGGYRIEIFGEPNWAMEIGNPGYADPTGPGTLATALRLVNAIPAVCAAEPGLVTPFDLPTITGRGLYSPAA